MTHAATQHGFSLIEMILSIVIIASLAAVAAPRFFGLSEFEERVGFDGTQSALRYAQKLAVATGCGVQVTVSGNTYTLNQEPGCTGGVYSLDVPNPATGGSTYTGSPPTGISLTSDVSPFRFDALGRATNGSGTTTDVNLTVGSRSLKVEGETGFVHVP